jgi:ribosomal protein S18 acetylase RimI-like enzyme
MVSMATEAELAALDNPIWHCLTTRHLQFAVGSGLARRFDREIGPLAGMREPNARAYEDLAELFSPGEPAALFLESEPKLPLGWSLQRHETLDQMICEEMPCSQNGRFNFEWLTEADVPKMLELTRLTEPGPFRKRTLELGGFLGIREDERLAAMAGQRLALPGLTEVSAVCTHPDFRGRGYAAALVAAVARAIGERGDTPFLTVLESNTAAIRVYESIGFRLRRKLHLAVVFPPPAAGDADAESSGINR